MAIPINAISCSAITDTDVAIAYKYKARKNTKYLVNLNFHFQSLL